MSRLFASVLCLVFVGCALDDPDVTNPESTPVMDESTPTYNPYIFREYGDPIVLIDEPPVDEPEDRCVLDCYDAYDVAYDACTAGPHTIILCEKQADDAVGVCLIVECISGAAPPSKCATKCDGEREVATDECVDNVGYKMECVTHGQAVYDTCHLAECSTTDINKPPHVVPDLIGDPGPTCREKCQALDDKHYLLCLESGEEVQRCRDEKGTTYHLCLVDHCPPGG